MPASGNGTGQSGGTGGKVGTGIPALQRWIDDLGTMGTKRRQHDMQGQHLAAEEQATHDQATTRLFLTLLEQQAQQEAQAQAQAAKAQADQQAAASVPFQVQVPPESPMAQRPVSFDRALTQMPSSFDALMLAAQGGKPAGTALQPGAQARAPTGAPGLPAAASGLGVAGPTQQQRQTTVGVEHTQLEDPFRFLTLTQPTFQQQTTETPNELTADDIAGLRVQEAAAAEAQRHNQAGEAVDTGRLGLDTNRARGDYAQGAEKLAIDRAQLEVNRTEAQARMTLARAQALAAGEKFTPGEKSLDDEYARKAYAPQLSGGFAAAADDIAALKDIGGRLLEAVQGGGSNLTGPFLGATPGKVLGVTNPQAAALRRDLESVLQKSAKTVLDSQYAAREMADYLAREADTQQEEGVVLQRIVPMVNRLEFDLSEAQRKADHFRANGSLRGFEPAPVPPEISSEALRKAFEPVKEQTGGQAAGAPTNPDADLFKRYGIE